MGQWVVVTLASILAELTFSCIYVEQYSNHDWSLCHTVPRTYIGPTIDPTAKRQKELRLTDHP
jgi:hypothetical protein